MTVGVLVLTACTSESPASPTPKPLGEPTTSAPAEPGSTADPDPVPVTLVGHATRPQLDLTAAAMRAAERGLAPRGLRLVDTIAQVERDPGAVAVVPLDEVGPTVVAATVNGVDPVRDATEAIDLIVVGDLMLVRGVPDPAAALRPMTPRLAAADLTVGNLESTLSTNGSPTQGGDSFGGSPALLSPLRRAGFDALSVGNNHVGDYGEAALIETLASLRGSQMTPFGAGPDRAGASRPAILERGGVRFGFVAFNAIGETPRAAPGVPGALSVRMPPRTGPLVRADLDHLADVVRRTARDADVVIVLPHWGDQYTHAPEQVQRVVGRRLVRAGADLVVGGHPHWVQGVDSVGGVPLVHSLGNFVFDMGPAAGFPEQTRQGAVLETTWWGAELKAIRFVPYRMDPTQFAPRVVKGTEAAGILADVWSTSTGPFSATRR